MAQVIVKKENKIIAKLFNRTKVYEVTDTVIDDSQKKIGLNLDNQLNILQLSKTDEQLFSLYTSLIDRGYIFYLHYNKISYFIKKEFIDEIWQRKDLYIDEQVLYTLNEPINEPINSVLPYSLLVVFSSFPHEKFRESSRVSDRMFETYFSNIQNQLIENTVVLRIFDNNLTYGSYYLNSTQFPNFENSVQHIIHKVQNQFAIKPENVVCLGEGKGGTGALYHANLGGYSSVSVVPILNDTDKEMYEEELKLTIKTKIELEPRMDEVLSKGTDKKHYILTNDSFFSYDHTKKYQQVSIVNYPTGVALASKEFSECTQPLQTTLINEQLFTALSLGDKK